MADDVEKGTDENAYIPPMDAPALPTPLTYEEKKYLLAVERGDMGNVRRMLQMAHRKKHFDINCVDTLGRGALTLAIDGENMEMVELLVIMGVETKDALLQAINAEFVEAVELLLEHEELIHKEGDLYSWEKVNLNTAMFTPDITPLILAAHKNNYEIIKILLDRGATLPIPHDIKCGCDECIKTSSDDSLRHSLSRLNEYRALASPSLIALSSEDPILTAFQLSWELRNMAFAEQESKSDYLELRRQCQQFAVDLLDQTRSSTELAIILNHNPEDPPYQSGDHMKLSRLELAINFKQKKFVAHPNIQQLLATLWYEGVPGFRRKTSIEKLMICVRVALLFPFYCMVYMIAPNCQTGKFMRKPFMKFLIHASSYLFFLLILILVSQRAEVQLIQLFGPEWMQKNLEKELLKQRGNGPTYLELLVVIYVIGFIWEETHEIYIEGIQSYLRNMWNFIDFSRNSLYVMVVLLRIAAYLEQTSEIRDNPETRFIPREQWNAFDPQLIAEGLFAAANIFSALKLVHMFSINPHLGPLQISLGRMVIDIVKFFFIYSLVLFAFACGLNQLLWYFADLEKKKCYVLPGGLPDWDNAADSCMKWRSFGNVFEASQSLFWASFGMVGLENFELTGIKSYTRFWGLLMFGSYSVINVIVLLNLLIAMMSNSYAMIDEHSDTEWKFARTRLWMSYFEESATLPPPFNIMPTPKLIFKMLGLRKKRKIQRLNTQERKDHGANMMYTAVMRALVWRYVSAVHRRLEDDPVTEDDINELKGDVSALRYELLEVFDKNGMDVSFTDRKEKAVLGKRMKVWERRLMKDFHVAPVTSGMEEDEPPEDEGGLAKFRRVAKLAAQTSRAASPSGWDEVIKIVSVNSQIGKSRSRDSFKSQQNLQKAMDEAKKLVMRSPIHEASGNVTPIKLPPTPGRSILEILKDCSDEPEQITPEKPADTMDKLSVSAAMQSVTSIPNKSRSQSLSNDPTVVQQTTIASVEKSPKQASNTPSPKPTPEPSPLKSKRIQQGDSPPRVIKHKPPPPPPTIVTTAPPTITTTPPTITTTLPPLTSTSPLPKSPTPPPTPKRSPTPSSKPQSRAASPVGEPVVGTLLPDLEQDFSIQSSVIPRPVISSGALPTASGALPPPPLPASKPPASPAKTTAELKPVQQPPVAEKKAAPAPPAPLPSPPPTPGIGTALASSSSTEQLIPTQEKPRKLDDVRTIRKQSKSGWL